MPKMVCVQCEVEYKIAKSGAYVIEYFGNPPRPYKVWNADGWECPVCGHKVVAGFGFQALAEHYEEAFPTTFEHVQKSIVAREGWVINDYELKYRPVAEGEA